MAKTDQDHPAAVQLGMFPDLPEKQHQVDPDPDPPGGLPDLPVGPGEMWEVCPACEGANTAARDVGSGGCDRCNGDGVIPSSLAPGWFKTVIRQHRNYFQALWEIATWGDGNLNYTIIRAMHRELIDIAIRALEWES